MVRTSRKNFSGWLRARRETALANLESRLALPDKEFRNTTKRLWNSIPNADNKKLLDEHRVYLKNQVEILKERLKRTDY